MITQQIYENAKKKRVDNLKKDLQPNKYKEMT